MDKKFKVQSTRKYKTLRKYLTKLYTKIFLGFTNTVYVRGPIKNIAISHAGVLSNQNHLPPVNSVQAS